MAGKPSAMQNAAQKQWEAAPVDNKPTSAELAKKHKLSQVAILQSKWWKSRNQATKEQK